MTLHPKLPLQILEAQTKAIKEENIKAENLRGMDKAFKTALPNQHISSPPKQQIVWTTSDPISHHNRTRQSFTSIFRQSMQNALGTSIRHEYGLSTRELTDKVTKPSKHSKDMLRPVFIDFGKGWGETLTTGKFSYNTVTKQYEGSKHHSRQLYGQSVCPYEKVSSDFLESEEGLKPRYIGPFKILKRDGPRGHNTLELPEELSNVHNTFHVSNLKKCLSDESLVILMKELRLDDKLNFVEEPIEIMDREVKQLRQSRISIVKVRWNSKRGPEFTWEREDQIRAKYPHLFPNTTLTSN
ncbi:hypothetical protein Tco_1546991 [Tanacetum coccineum]